MEWENIGTALHIDSSILKAIGLRNHYKPEECFTEVLYYWLCQEPPPTLNVLKKCMMSLSLRESCPRLDEDLERNFNQVCVTYAINTIRFQYIFILQFELSCPDTSAMDESEFLFTLHLLNVTRPLIKSLLFQLSTVWSGGGHTTVAHLPLLLPLPVIKKN